MPLSFSSTVCNRIRRSRRIGLAMIACVGWGCATDDPPALPDATRSRSTMQRSFHGIEGLQSRLTLGIAQLEDKAYEPCRILAAIITRDAPEDPAGPVLLGLAHAGKGNVDAAANAFRDAASRAPDNAHVQFLLAESLQRSGDWPGARTAFEAVIELDPEDLATRAVLAENLLYRHELTEAIAVLRGIVALDPGNLKVLLQLGEALVENGDSRSARHIYEKVRSANPDMSPGAQEHLARALQLLESEGPSSALREFRFAGNLQRADASFDASRRRLETVPYAGPISRITALPGPTATLSGAPWHTPPQILSNGAVSDAAVMVSPTKTTLLLTGSSPARDQEDLANARVLSFQAHTCAPGDFDGDGSLDLAISDASGDIAIIRGHLDGGFDAPVTIASLGTPATTLLPLDHDLDGDTDLLGATPRVFLLRNDGDGHWSPQDAGLSALSAQNGILVEDLDGDRDMDLLLLANNETTVAHYLGNGLYASSSASLPAARAGVFLPGNDGRPRELWLIPRNGIPRVQRWELDDAQMRPSGDSWPLGGDGSGTWILAGWDLELDGVSDLLALPGDPGRDKALLLSRRSDSSWDRIDTHLGDLPRTDVAALADLDFDGTLDLVVGGPDGSAWVRASPPRNRRTAHVDAIAVKDARDGIGTHVRAWAGLLTIDERVDPHPGTGIRRPHRVYFGIGDREILDRVKVRWGNDIWQDETSVPRSETVVITQNPALAGSCPFLYAWDGNQFEFVTDLLGGAPLGLALEPGAYFPANPRETVRVEHMEPRNGAYEVRVTEELREAAYLDAIELVIVDVPPGAEAHPSDALTPPPFREERIHVLLDPFHPKKAQNQDGLDVTHIIEATDELYTGESLTHHPMYQGLTQETHSLELDLGTQGDPERLVLALHGGFWWSEAGNYSASQSGAAIPPRLEVPDGVGGWRTAVAPFGFPGGRPKTVICDLTGKVPAEDPRVRIVTNFRLHWDEIQIDTVATPVTPIIHRLPPESAELHHRGYSRAIPTSAPVPGTFDYQVVEAGRPYPRMAGAYTRFGNVLPLLSAADNRLVVMGHGEELVLSFSTIAPPPPDWKRDVLFFSVGWDKDGDPKTAHFDTVDPLPFLDMTGYPYSPGEAYPATDALHAYAMEWNTRLVHRTP